ncbi:hypothetical protein MCEMIH16_02531 [Caulobacteraceae bacterium]
MMMRCFGLVGGLALALLLAEPGRALAEDAPAPTGVLPLEGLPTQTLASGQCALFLWARTTPPRRVLMALQDPAIARIRLDGKSLDLPRVAAEGEALYGHFPVQRFEGEGVSVSVTIQMDARSGLVGGVVVPAGWLEYRDRKGWETIVPVAGMVGCQP